MRWEAALDEDRLQDAATQATDCLALDPFNPRAWLARGDVSLVSGDVAAAWAAYENAVVYGPGNASTLVTLALLADRLGFRRRADAIWHRALTATTEAQRAIIEGYRQPAPD